MGLCKYSALVQNSGNFVGPRRSSPNSKKNTRLKNRSRTIMQQESSCGLLAHEAWTHFQRSNLVHCEDEPESWCNGHRDDTRSEARLDRSYVNNSLARKEAQLGSLCISRTFQATLFQTIFKTSLLREGLEQIPICVLTQERPE